MEIEQINILGYSGSYLALLFETISANKFNGTVNIIQNEEIKRAIAPFDTGIRFNEIHFSEMAGTPEKGFVFCSNKPSTKKFLFELYSKIWRIKKQAFISLVHPSSVIASTVKPAFGLYMEPLSVISPYSQIGFGVTINRNCSVGHHNIIGEYSSVHPGVNLCGHVELGKNVAIGAGSTVFSNVKIGNNSVIGGGSVVIKDIPDNVLAFGNPCKIIKKI